MGTFLKKSVDKGGRSWYINEAVSRDGQNEKISKEILKKCWQTGYEMVWYAKSPSGTGTLKIEQHSKRIETTLEIQKEF